MDPSVKRHAEWKSAVARLRQSATLMETGFVSNTPVIGALVARGRGLWNSVSTKWYVRPVLHQQSNFNQNVVEVLDQLSTELARVSSVLERVVERLDERNLDVNAPRESLRAIEQAVIEAERLAVGVQRDVARLNLRLAQTGLAPELPIQPPGRSGAGDDDPSP